MDERASACESDALSTPPEQPQLRQDEDQTSESALQQPARLLLLSRLGRQRRTRRGTLLEHSRTQKNEKWYKAVITHFLLLSIGC